MSHASTQQLAPDMTSDATFRAWGSAISAKIAAMGLVQTGDTGQINWTTVSKPGAGNTAAGYEIWRFADSLQATAPVYVKLEYGSGSATANPGLWITVGTGSNGSGTLTGQVSSRNAVAAQATSTSSSTCVFSGDTNRMCMSLWGDGGSANYRLVISLERTHDSSGADTATGALICTKSVSTSTLNQYLPFSGAVPSTVTTWCSPTPPGASSGNYGTDVGIYPHYHFSGGQWLNQTFNLMTYFNADVLQGTTAQMTVYGAAHTYYFTGSGANSSFDGNTNTRLCMRYE